MLFTASPCGHERHTGEYTLRLKQQHLHVARVGIESTSDSVFKCVRDNGSNMVLAWVKDGAIPCFDHTLELHALGQKIRDNPLQGSRISRAL